MIKLVKLDIGTILIPLLLLQGPWLHAQSLQGYMEMAKNNNAMIHALESRYGIAREQVNEVRAIPATRLSAGYFISEPETRTGPQRARFSIAQMLPWFGTIGARRRYAGAKADAQFMEIAIKKRKIALSVAQSYYELYAIRAQQRILDTNIDLLSSYEELALNAVEVDRASTVDVLRLQIRKSDLQQEKENLQQDFLAERTSFNALLNRDETEPVNVITELRLPENDLTYSEQALKAHPELLKYDQILKSIQQSELVNRKEEAPKIGIGLDYVPVTERPEMNFSDNGKDIVMPMLSLEIPLFSGKYTSVSKQNTLREQENMHQKKEQFNTLRSLFAKALAARNKARITYEAQRVNSAKAQNAEEILLKNYETGTMDFTHILDLQELQLQLQKKQIEAVRQYYAQSAIMNYLTN